MEVKNEYENGFIYGFEIDEKMCDDLINWFEETELGEHYSPLPTDTIAKFKGRTVGDSQEDEKALEKIELLCKSGEITKEEFNSRAEKLKILGSPKKNNVLENLKLLHKRGRITKDELHRRAGKHSTDLSFGAFNKHPAVRNYLDKGLASVIQKYKEKFPYAFDEGNLGFVPPGCMPDSEERRKTGYGNFPWAVGTTMNIQKYDPGEGFFCWHTERTVPIPETVDRALVFMTYLNDVPNGGTKFFHQGITTPAKKGLTLIWPVDWTHLHSGQITENSEKYIITGWINYVRAGESIPYFLNLKPRISK